jgi:hypothetical protein
MIRLSSSLTLGFALFFPVFWFVLFGCLTLFILALDAEDLPISNPSLFKMSLSIGFLFFGFLIYKGPMKLRRVELENDHLFVTNYFKTITFNLQQISNIHVQSILGLTLVTLQLEYKSSFGKKIRFLSDSQRVQYLMDKKKEESNSSMN